jgi:hypothetical protein
LQETRVELDQIGILTHEPLLAVATWSGAFTVIYLGFLSVQLFDYKTTVAAAVALDVLIVAVLVLYFCIDPLKPRAVSS